MTVPANKDELLKALSLKLYRFKAQLSPPDKRRMSGLATFAANYAERVLKIFEAELPDDMRPRQAIEAARDRL